MTRECHIPSLEDHSIYSEWKNEVKIWQEATSLAKKKQAPNIVLSMRGKAKRAIMNQLGSAELATDTGMTTLLAALDELYSKDKTKTLFSAIDQFERFQRPKTMEMDEYITEFMRLESVVKMCRENKAGYEDGILAYRLLMQANLTHQ